MEFTGSTAVYIGKIVKPYKKISEDADDQAHINDDAPSHIKFMHASGAHKFMVDKILKQEQGITYNLFKNNVDFNEGEGDGDGNEEEEDPDAPKKEKVLVEKLPKHLVVDEIVREKDMHYYQVPKLGSYFAIRLEYQSCLFEEAFDEAVKEYKRVEEERAKQLAEKMEFEEAQADLKREKEENGEEFVPEVREWPEIQEAPYKNRVV